MWFRSDLLASNLRRHRLPARCVTKTVQCVTPTTGRRPAMQEILDVIMAAEQDADPAATLRRVADVPVPSQYRGVAVRVEDVHLFDGLDSRDKDPRKSLQVIDVPTPELGPGEALIAVMASAVNYNTVWTSIFEPIATFKFLQKYARTSELARKHDRPYHVVGSD